MMIEFGFFVLGAVTAYLAAHAASQIRRGHTDGCARSKLADNVSWPSLIIRLQNGAVTGVVSHDTGLAGKETVVFNYNCGLAAGDYVVEAGGSRVQPRRLRIGLVDGNAFVEDMYTLMRYDLTH